MADPQGNFLQRHWFLTLVVLAALFSLVLVAGWRRVSGGGAGGGGGRLSGILGGGRGGQQPTPPPPSDQVPDAPGPDNTLQHMEPRPGVPPQPPSPIQSETDPSKKPKEKK